MAWDISELGYIKSKSTYGSDPLGLTWKPDGTKLYVVDNNDAAVHQYDVSTAWDIDTASFEKSLDVSDHNTSPTGIFIGDSGTKLYLSADYGYSFQWNLSTAWDIGSASFYDSNTSQGDDIEDISWNDDGTIMYEVDRANDEILQYSVDVAWDITESLYQKKLTHSNIDAPQGITWKDDGTKLYVVDADNTWEFDLFASWDISKASFNQSIDSQDVVSEGIFFKPDGTKMYEVGLGDGKIYESDLSTAWDISTASFSQSIDTQDDVPRGIFFKDDGTKMYEVGSNDEKIYESDLNTAWDISTASFSQSIDSQDGTPTGIFFKSDGTKMYEVGSYDDKIYESDLSTAWDISTASFNQSIDTQDSISEGLFFKDDGTKMYEVGSGDDKIYEYDLNTAWDISTASFSQSIDTQDDYPKGISFKDDGTKMYEVGSGDDKIYEYDLSGAWDLGTASYSKFINQEGSYTRGLDWGNDGKNLYFVDSDDEKIYLYGLPPEVSTNSASDIRAGSADGEGEITDVGSEDCDERGFVYSTISYSDPGNKSPEDSIYENSVNETGTFGTGTFSLTIKDLSDETTYYVRAYAHNSAGYSYGSEVSFTTTTAPSLTTDPASDISSTAATLNGTLSDLGSYDSIDIDFRLNTDTGGVWGSTSSTGSHSETRTDLDPDTTYTYEFKAYDGITIWSGGEVEFTTKELPNLSSDYYVKETLVETISSDCNISLRIKENITSSSHIKKTCPSFFVLDYDHDSSTFSEGTLTNVKITDNYLELGDKPYLHFDGSDDYVALDKYYDTSGQLTSLTVEAWANVPTDGGDWSILDFDRSEYYTCAAGIPSGSTSGEGDYVSFQTSDDSSSVDDLYSDSSIRDGEWHHIAWVFDGTDKIIYIDGAKDSTQAIDNIGTGTTRYGFIGDGSEADEYDGQRNNNYFKGSIHDIKVWDNTSKSEQEIKNDMYNVPVNDSGITNYYKFDDGSGSTLSDSVGSGDGGINSATWETRSDFYISEGSRESPTLDLSTGVMCTGSKISWLGGDELFLKDSYVAIEDYNYSSSVSELTVEAYFRTRAENDFIIASFDGNEYWRLEIGGNGGGSDGKVGMSFKTDSGQVDGFNSSTTVNDGEWHHVAFVYDNGDAYLYIDGVQENSTSSGSTIGTGTTRYGFLGANSEASSFDDDKSIVSNGWLSNFRVWSVARSEQEIITNKDKYPQGSDNGLEICYDFVEGHGDTLYNKSSSENNGIINGGLWPLLIETNVSLDGGSSWLGWNEATNNSGITDLVTDDGSGDNKSVDISDAKLKVRQTLKTYDRTYSPSLKTLSVNVSGSPSLYSSSSIKDTNSKNIDCTSNIKKSTSKTIESNINILSISSPTINHDYIILAEYSGSIQSDSLVKASIDKNIQSDTSIKTSYEEELSSSSYIVYQSTPHTQSDYYIKTHYDDTISSDGYLSYAFSDTLVSDYMVLSPTKESILSEAFLVGDKQRFLLSDNLIKQTYEQEIDSSAYILFPWLRSDSYIKRSRTRVRRTASWISEPRKIQVTSDIFVEKEDNALTITSDYWLSTIEQDTITSDWYLKAYTTKTINTDSKIKTSYEHTISSGSHIDEIKEDTISSDFDIIEPVTTTATSDYYITTYYTSTITTDTSIVDYVFGVIESDYSIKSSSVGEIESFLRVIQPVTVDIKSDSRLIEPTKTTIIIDTVISKARDKTIDSNAEINVPLTETISSDATISLSKENNLNAIYYINKRVQSVIQSDTQLVEEAREYLVSDYYIERTYSVETLSSAYISESDFHTIQSDYYVAECGDWSEVWKISLLYTFNVTIQCDYIITGEGTKPNVCDAQYVNKPEIIYASSDKPEVIDGNYVNKPNIYGGTTG